MDDRHQRFDPEKLTARKNDFCGFRFCPLCGKELKRGEVDHLTRPFCPNPECGFIYYQNPIPAAGAIIVQNRQVLLVKRAYPPQVGWWCLPAGFMEWNEHPRETTARELEEETGLIIAIDSFFDVYSGNDDPRSNAILLLYLAHTAGGELQAGDDADEVRYFDLDELPENIAFQAHNQALVDYKARHPEK